jgi:uncharacterized protein (TIGR02118 family)
MVKLIALYKKPESIEDFDRHFFSTHLPLVRRYPGVRHVEVIRVSGAPIGEAKFHLLEELTFDTRDAMDAALASKEGKAVTRDLMTFAAEWITVFHGEVEPE